MKNALINLRQRVTTGWTFLRIVRLVLALIITIEALNSSEFLFAILGGFLAFQAVFNYGCCGASGCDIDHRLSKSKSPDETNEVTTFEEIK
jgi:hypothetical protein